MKNIFLMMVVVTCSWVAGCFTERELEAEIVEVHLIRVDTIQRCVNQPEIQLIWESKKDGVQYVSYKNDHVFEVGERMLFLRRR